MPNTSELKIDLYEDSPQNRKERLINRRLIPVYNMAVASILHYRNGQLKTY
jgi:hypothetical protein